MNPMQVRLTRSQHSRTHTAIRAPYHARCQEGFEDIRHHSRRLYEHFVSLQNAQNRERTLEEDKVLWYQFIDGLASLSFRLHLRQHRIQHPTSLFKDVQDMSPFLGITPRDHANPTLIMSYRYCENCPTYCGLFCPGKSWPHHWGRDADPRK